MALLKKLGVGFDVCEQALMVGQVGHGGVVEHLVPNVLLDRIKRIFVHVFELLKDVGEKSESARVKGPLAQPLG